MPERLHLAAYDPWVSYAAALLLAVAAMYFVERPARKANPASAKPYRAVGQMNSQRIILQKMEKQPVRPSGPLPA